MIEKEEINKTLSKYKKPRIATICSHSALQIFHGAHQEGFETIGISKEERVNTYDSFPLAMPDKYIIVKDFKELCKKDKCYILLTSFEKGWEGMISKKISETLKNYFNN